MKSILILLTFLLLQSDIISQVDNSTPFIKIMKAEFDAFQKKDPSIWSKYADDEAIFTGIDNSVKTKTQIMEEMKTASEIFKSAKETYDNVVTKIFGNTAILSCITTFTYINAGGNKESLKFKFTRVHVKEGAEWKLVYHSAIPL
jgi:ketosteroid isomerase-like protein